MLQTNCFVIGDTETNEAIVVDPVDNADVIIKTAAQSGWTIKKILATHGHFDHVLGSKPLKEATGAPFYIHEAEMEWLNKLPEQGIMFTGERFPEAAQPDEFLTTEPQTVDVGAIHLETIFTPGHSPGHISFYMPEHKIVFSGDCLFTGSIGRTDLPGGDYTTLMESIIEKLLPLGDDVQVLNGHSPPTTIGRERISNPFILSHLSSA
jgi:glyoxylase-like metal-dependent hydrolase (beta-lactamase superfamily II)